MKPLSVYSFRITFRCFFTFYFASSSSKYTVHCSQPTVRSPQLCTSTLNCVLSFYAVVNVRKTEKKARTSKTCKNDLQILFVLGQRYPCGYMVFLSAIIDSAAMITQPKGCVKRFSKSFYTNILVFIIGTEKLEIIII